MATIEIEDGTGKSNSNSYVTETELGTYASDRGKTLNATTDALKVEILIQAMDYLESRNFIGDKNTEDQALQWPRVNAILDGYYIDTDEIPTLLKESQMEYAISIDAGTNPLASEGRETRREKVGSIEVEYAATARSSTYIKAAETKLAKLVKFKEVINRFLKIGEYPK